MGKVWDVTKPPRSFRQATTEELITELFNRGTSIETIFGQFYALEEMASNRDDELFGNDEEGRHGRAPLTVGDARLAGFGTPVVNYKQPF